MQVAYRPDKRASRFCVSSRLELTQSSQHRMFGRNFDIISLSLTVYDYLDPALFIYPIKWFDLSSAHGKPTLNGYKVLHLERFKHLLTFFKFITSVFMMTFIYTNFISSFSAATPNKLVN
jgi:hypothetical protein